MDRSILDPEAFLRTDVLGVHVLLEACRIGPSRTAPRSERAAAPRFLQVSTDEVYGSVETGESREDDRLEPRSPYSAAKAGGELLAHSYFVTYGLDVVITRGSNTYGPYHHPEKLIPLFVTNAIDDQALPLYGDGLQRRDWLYVSDHAGAIGYVLENGASGEIYNVPGDNERSNREVVAALLDRLGKPWSLVRTVEDRPGHDRRYAMDGSKLRALGWGNGTPFEDGLAATIDWYRENEAWWRPIKSGEWDDVLPPPVRDPARRLHRDRAMRFADRMRVAVTGAGGRLGSCLTLLLRNRPFVGRGAGLGPARPRPRRSGVGRTAGFERTGPTWSSTRPPGPTWTAAPAIPDWPCAATASPRARWPRPARAPARRWS